jgi:hypothetical protein
MRQPRSKNPHDGWDIVPSATGFDFLEGGFSRAERARAAALSGVGACLVVLASVGLYGVTMDLEASTLERDISAARSQLATLTQELAVLDSAGGFSSQQIAAHVAQQEAALAAAVGGEWDTVRLTGDILASAPTGVTVTEVSFDDTAVPVKVTVSATATSFTALPDWSARLGTIAGLEGVDVTWSGGGERVSVEATATLSPDAQSARARAVAPLDPAQGQGGGAQEDPTEQVDELEGGRP